MNRHLDDQELLGVVFELDEGETLETHRQHLVTCAECRAKAAALKARIDQVALLRDDVRAPAALVERTIAAAEEPAGTLIPWPRTVALLASAAAIAVVALWQPWQMPQHPQPADEIEVALAAAPAAAAPRMPVPPAAPEPVVLEPVLKDAPEASPAIASSRSVAKELRPASATEAAPATPPREAVAAKHDGEARMRTASRDTDRTGSAAQPKKVVPPPPAAAPAPAPRAIARSTAASRPVETPAPVVAAKLAAASVGEAGHSAGGSAAPGASRENVADASVALQWDADQPALSLGDVMPDAAPRLTLQLPDGNRIVNEHLTSDLAYRLVRNGSAVEIVWQHSGTQSVAVILLAPGTHTTLQTLTPPPHAVSTNRISLPSRPH